ncbi:MAG: hypothetical protein HKO81_01230 [Flavobacteriaceae bacterium]|nr:hypothetical protein [Flavobacteriaceae bacterium]
MSENKSWSLQGDKRTEKERNLFKPTGKSPKNNTVIYVFSLAGVFLLVSFLMTYFSETVLEACFTNSNCFNSKDNIFLYTIYVFLNIVIVVLAIYGAYMVGRKIANIIKK